jgi:hypothetical protein
MAADAGGAADVRYVVGYLDTRQPGHMDIFTLKV